MSKVLVDRELLELAVSVPTKESLEANQAAIIARGRAQAEIRELLAQPAEAEGVGNARLMNTLAELARRAPLRTLHTICETQHQVSTVKLERYLEPIGDTLAGYAFTLRIDFDKLSAALAAVTAERDKSISLTADYIAMLGEAGLQIDELTAERDRLLAQVQRMIDQTTPLEPVPSDPMWSQRIRLDEVLAERDALREQVKVLQSDANSWQSGYDKGRHDGTKHRQSEVEQLRGEVDAGKWMPLSEATPPDGVPVLRWPGWAAEISIDEWCADYCCFLMSIEGGERATHWKPLSVPGAALAAKEG